MGDTPEKKEHSDAPPSKDELSASSGIDSGGHFRDAAGTRSTAARLREEAATAVVKLSALSPREREVLGFIAEGLSIKEIATSLAVSPKSVETYRARLLEKLDAKTPTALMRIAVLVSLLTPPDDFDAGG